MAIHLASKYEQKVAERYSRQSVTDSGAGHDYEFTGVKEIKVYSIDTVSMSDYGGTGTTPNFTGLSRFGSVAELGDTVQTLLLAKDRAFTYSIDAGNASEQFNIKQASATLKRQIDEVITPEVDTYRLNAWANGHGLSSGFAVDDKTASAALTKSTILDEIFTAHAQMNNNNVSGEVICYMPELEYVKCKLADAVIAGDQLNKEGVEKGFRGTLDGMKVITVPSNRWPTFGSGSGAKTINFILKAKGTTVDPIKLKNYRIQKNPAGLDGDLVEGRIMYDAFVLDAKCKGILVDHL